MSPTRSDPFSGATELCNEHDALMARIEQAMGADKAGPGSEATALRGLEPALRAFVERAVATGARIEAADERSACQALIDYWSTKLSRLNGDHALPRLGDFDESANPELPDEACPFIGAQPYEAGGLLEGRGAETAAVVSLVHAWPVVVVSGPAGSGKTSLVLAGALPRLRAERSAEGRPGWRVADAVRPGPTLLADLSQAVAGVTGADAAALERALGRDPAALARALGNAQELPPAVVTLDQADALLASAGQPALKAALEALVHAAEAGHRVLFVLREEFAERLLELPPLARWRGLDAQGRPRCGRLNVPPMSPAQLREAIVRPCEAVGLHLQAEVVDELVDRLAGQRAALPLLQHAMRTLWSARRRNRVSWDDYLQVRDALDAEKWRVEAEIQRAAAERGRAAAEANERLARHERRLRRATLAASLALLLAAGGLAWWAAGLASDHEDLKQAYKDQGAYLARNGPLLDECQDLWAARRRGAVLVDGDFVRRAETQAARLAACERDAGGGARTPAPKPPALPPLPADAAPLAKAPQEPSRPSPVASEAAAVGVAAAPSAPVAASAPASASVAPSDAAWQQAMQKLSDEDRRRRAQRLAFGIDRQKPAHRVEELRRLHPLSWYWALSRWNDLKLRSPLSLAVLFDTAIAQGPLQASTMRARAAPSDGSLDGERQLIESILARRHALAETALSPQDEPRRMAALRALLDKEDWGLDGYATWGGG